jgi:hypothetical protein
MRKAHKPVIENLASPKTSHRYCHTSSRISVHPWLRPIGFFSVNDGVLGSGGKFQSLRLAGKAFPDPHNLLY